MSDEMIVLAEDDYIRNLSVLADNANADGDSTNRVQYSNYSAETLEPISGETVLFQVTKGAAKFTNGSPTYRTVTESDGTATASLTNTTAETVTVQVTSTTAVHTPLTADVTFKKGDTFTIDSVTTEDGRVFAEGQPTVAWSGAVIKIKTKGGSGDISWFSSADSHLALVDVLTDGALFRFTSDAVNDRQYRIVAIDRQTSAMVTDTITLTDFYDSFGTQTLHELVDYNTLPSPTQLLNLYSQWGPMSNYKGWTEHTDIYWTNEGFFTLVTLINVNTGEVKTGSSIIGSHGYARLRK